MGSVGSESGFLARARPLHGGGDTWRTSRHCAPVGLPAPRPACLPAGTHGQARQAGRASCRAASTARGNDRRGGARPLFLFLSPAGGGDRGATLSGAQAESKEKRGHTQRLEVAPAVPPHPPLSPQGERGRRTRIAREDDRSGGTARGGDKQEADAPLSSFARACPASARNPGLRWRSGRQTPAFSRRQAPSLRLRSGHASACLRQAQGGL